MIEAASTPQNGQTNQRTLFRLAGPVLMEYVGPATPKPCERNENGHPKPQALVWTHYFNVLVTEPSKFFFVVLNPLLRPFVARGQIVTPSKLITHSYPPEVRWIRKLQKTVLDQTRLGRPHVALAPRSVRPCPPFLDYLVKDMLPDHRPITLRQISRSLLEFDPGVIFGGYSARQYLTRMDELPDHARDFSLEVLFTQKPWLIRPP